MEWWDQDCERAKRQRMAAYKKWEHTKDLADLINYKKINSYSEKNVYAEKKRKLSKACRNYQFTH